MEKKSHVGEISLQLTTILVIVACVHCFANCQIHAEPIVNGRLTGTLISHDGKSLADATVRLVRAGGLLRGISTVTRSDGSFVFDSVVPGDYVVGCGTQASQGFRVTVESGKERSLRCQLKTDDAFLLKGVVTAAGSPASGQLVSLVQLAPDLARWVWPPPVAEARTGSDGSYELAILPGQYLIRVRDITGLAPQYLVIAELGSGQNTLDIRIPERSLEGTVIDPSGIPVPHAMVFLSHSQLKGPWVPFVMSTWVETDNVGEFVFPHVDPGAYDLVVAQLHWSERDSSVGIQLCANVKATNEERQGVLLKMTQPIMIQTQLRVKGSTIDSPYVMVISKDHSKLRTIMKHRRFPEGFPVLGSPALFPAGKYLLFAMADVGNSACEASVVDSAVEGHGGHELAPSGQVKVVLQGESVDVAGRTIRLWHEDGTPVLRLYDPRWSYDIDLAPAIVLPTAPDGITIISHLRPGRYDITVDGADAKSQVEVTANRTVTVFIKTAVVIQQ